MDLVSELYYVDGDSLNLALAASKLDPKKAAGTQQIAILVAAGRQAGGWDEWTPVARIRAVCRDYGRVDEANFASTIKRMGDVFSFLDGAEAAYAAQLWTHFVGWTRYHAAPAERRHIWLLLDSDVDRVYDDFTDS